MAENTSHKSYRPLCVLTFKNLIPASKDSRRTWDTGERIRLLRNHFFCDEERKRSQILYPRNFHHLVQTESMHEQVASDPTGPETQHLRVKTEVWDRILETPAEDQEMLHLQSC
ncbi:uncharacterized protein LOC118525944 [Halichoerus grypus]